MTYHCINNMIAAMALGDSSGFPYETMKPCLIKKISPELERSLITSGFFKSDMITDDTEHLILTYQALLESSDSSDIESHFQKALSKRLRGWFLTLPAGIGMATLKSLFKLSVGVSPDKTGVYSAGNGPLMRAPVIGAYYAHNDDLRAKLVRISTRITHIDPLAELSAQSLADIVSFLINNKATLQDKSDLKNNLIVILRKATQKSIIDSKSTDIWQQFIIDTQTALNSHTGFDDYARKAFKKGITGFSLHTLQAVIAQLYYNDTLAEVIRSSVYAGGDTDTTAGIAASVFSIISDEQINVDPEPLLNRMKSGYFTRLAFSLLGWGRSLLSLWRFIYLFKKI